MTMDEPNPDTVPPVDPTQPPPTTTSEQATTAPKKKNKKKKKSPLQPSSPPDASSNPPASDLTPSSSESTSSFNTVLAAGWGASPAYTTQQPIHSWDAPVAGVQFMQGSAPLGGGWSADAEAARLCAKSTKGWGNFGWGDQSSSTQQTTQQPSTSAAKQAQPGTSGWDVPVTGVQMFSVDGEASGDPTHGLKAWGGTTPAGTGLWNTPVSSSIRVNIQDDIDLADDPNALEGSLTYESHIEEVDDEDE
ncbi:hypothetical protein HDV00_010486 [Rhizophlyctis rosea]|nr:hypothetical protein HDV00_010486 [Rhizophlyctis rosea]